MNRLNVNSIISGIHKPSSELALGTAFFNIKNKEQCFDVLDAFMEAGGTIIDSARGYGTSEDVIGFWLENRSDRDRIIILTKCGLTADGVLPEDNYPELVLKELATSLRTLKTDYIDLYVLHRDNTMMPVWEILGPLNDAIARGQVSALGASNWEYRRVTEANEYAYKHGMKGFAIVSNNISLAVPAAAFYPGLISVSKADEEWHKTTKIPLIPWSSQARGFFTGRYTPQMRDNPDLVTDGFTKQMLKVYGTDENFLRLVRAKELGEKKGGYTAVEVALAWLLHKPFPIIPIVGPHTREETLSCVKATGLSLTERECK